MAGIYRKGAERPDRHALANHEPTAVKLLDHGDKAPSTALHHVRLLGEARRAGTQPTMTADPQTTEAEPEPEPDLSRRTRSERLLSSLAPFRRVVVVSHVNPDPDSLASMLGIKALVESASRESP